MSATKFSIPSEFQSQLRHKEVEDTRTNSDILESLTHYAPITSEKNIWAFWDKGVQIMHGWTQRDICDWVRICGTGSNPWTVRISDADPESPNYALKWVEPSLLPASFVDGTMEGPYIGPHSADFLRGALLYAYGGVFMDVGNLLLRHLDRVGWNELEDDSNPYTIAVPLMYGQVIANHFVMARKGDEFIKQWHDLFIHLWQERTSHVGIIQNPLLAFATNLDFSSSRASDFHWDFKIEPQEVFEYISQVLAWLRLCSISGSDADPFDGSEYWQRHVLCFDALQEDWPAEATVGFRGEDTYHALQIKVDGPKDETWQKSYNLVWRMLTKSSMQKVTHGKHLTKDVHLGVLWDMHDEDDCEVGTFAELLRYGAVHFEQMREGIGKMPVVRAEVVMDKGVLEA
ncbi:hypothetical protein CLAFUW4_07288 [Fulvia fulva]|uniref:uncharacterized protein n=1 Tax=Passalora fulva TaxID=5499 RepID=UPI0004E9D1AA|nr:uncharacterized protein CLAFUR5_20237 [Fulvia fulva]KAK4621996.1 hypothetical protein CLAFUR4_07296 [Fulvia fulva]KAK4623428.1 hypothetical protein CLAFUR0_07294 [Fulvia fulva]WMI38943.1 hypothetical protein CLAFUR5_20237 [Fulvia fulva]WPV15954.1 hypothetical protein CLAFUW4_07288 [Fulvia fulva]WPV30872.1 hypothetical protein CLAFUW7_07290 [Fulvia fulva]